MAHPGEPRWPMALAVIATGLLRATLPPQLRNGDAAWVLVALEVVLLVALIIGDPGRIDRDRPWLRNLTNVVIGVITLANASAAIRLVVGIVDVSSFTQNAKTLLAAGDGHLAHQHHRLRPVVLEPRPGWTGGARRGHRYRAPR